MISNINDHNWNKKLWSQLSSELKSKKSIFLPISVLLLDTLLIVTSIYLRAVSSSIALSLVSNIILLLPLTHFYLLHHEAVHRNISDNILINDIIGHVLGWLILLPFLPRKRSHILHHIWTGHPKGDPANARAIEAFSVMTKKQEKTLELAWKNWLPIMVINDRKGLWLNAFRQSKGTQEYNRLSKERQFTWAYLVCYLFLCVLMTASSLFSLILTLYIPSLIILLVIEEFLNLPHHAETPLLNESDCALPYWKQYSVTHSCQSVPLWSNFIILNFNLHTAHHFFPWLPWYRIPEANKRMHELLPELEEDQKGINTEFSWSIKNRRRPLLSIMGHYFKGYQD